MLFNSIEFLLFLPVVFLIHWKLLSGRSARNLFLLVASYVFYGWWNPIFLSLIFFTSICSFFSGILIEKYRDRRPIAKGVMIANIIVNLGILVTYKYFNFFAASFADMMALAGWSVDAVTLNVILPVGISFYTFQALSYSIDVYRRDIAATRDVVAFTVFISFFPQLVAGPIERATNLLPQFLRQRRFSYQRAVSGMRLALWGLFKKVVVADNAAPVVDHIFANYPDFGSASLWVAAVLFTFQIYCDFSGYSDIAIGVARLFGVELMRNFRFPIFARSIPDFWKRWHISLTSWFRDYIYIPLGGNRKGKLKKIRNTVVVFLVSGLWHGANYTYICWGAFHALLFVPHALFEKRKPADKEEKTRRPVPRFFAASLAMATTFFLVLFGWILFRADTITDAALYIRRMFTAPPGQVVMGKTELLWALVMMIFEWFARKKESPLDFEGHGLCRFRAARWTFYIIVIAAILLFAGQTENFIYFQF